MWTERGYAIWIASEFVTALVRLRVVRVPEVDPTLLSLGDLVDYYDAD